VAGSQVCRCERASQDLPTAAGQTKACGRGGGGGGGEGGAQITGSVLRTHRQRAPRECSLGSHMTRRRHSCRCEHASQDLPIAAYQAQRDREAKGTSYSSFWQVNNIAVPHPSD
jgi:hypothetical protein